MNGASSAQDRRGFRSRDKQEAAPRGLAGVWAQTLATKGLTHPVMLAEWLEDPRRGVVTESDLELLRLRVEERLGPREVGARVGISSEAVRRRTRRAGLLLVAAHVDEAPAWRRARGAGASCEDVAAVSGVDPVVVRLALGGWPPVARWTDEQMVGAVRAWRSGQPVDAVARELGLTRDRLTRHVRSGLVRLSPDRLTRADVARRLGWRDNYLRVRLADGSLPPPDGDDGGPWWWDGTVEAWASLVLRWWCEECSPPHAFLASKGLAAHRTRVHGASQGSWGSEELLSGDGGNVFDEA